jgi:hypothetical protein
MRGGRSDTAAGIDRSGGWGCGRRGSQQLEHFAGKGKSMARLVVWCVIVLGTVGLAASVMAAEGWTPVFNGKDLEGWKASDPSKFTVEDGCFVGSQSDGKGSDIFTTQEWDNFELRFTYKVVWPANSGVWFRGTNYQFDILKYKNPIAYSGTLYCPKRFFIFKNEDEAIENRDGWNEGQVYANGDHIIIWLNGKKIGECHDDTAAKGKIGIQVHGGNDVKNMRIIIKKMEVRTLKAGDQPTPPIAPKTE